MGDDWTVHGITWMFWYLEASSSRLTVMRLPSCVVQIPRVVTRWGLFLRREVHFFLLKVHSLWKAETVAQDQTQTLTSSFIGRYCSDPWYAVSEALSKELDPKLFT